jgi:hypothetical protein
MAGSRARESLNALTVARDTRAIQPSNTPVVDILRQDPGSASPLQTATEKRTNPQFLTTAHTGLVTQGFPDQAATAVLHEVVNRPAFAQKRGVPTQNGQHQAIVQGVVVDETPDMPDALIVLRATVSNAKPPQVDDVEITVHGADVSTPSGLSALVSDLAPLWSEFAVREPSIGPTGAPARLAWIGDTTPPAYRDVPADWNARVRATSGVLGMRTLIARTAEAARTQSVRDRVDLVFIPKGTARAGDYVAELKEHDLPFVEAGQPGTTFEELLTAFRDAVSDFVYNAVFVEQSTVRVLEPGQTVYHRKVGDSRGPYDSFDEGSDKPCVHDDWKSFKHADKATKGMARIYANFEPSWMQHCARFPNCGVYVVRRPV